MLAVSSCSFAFAGPAFGAVAQRASVPAMMAKSKSIPFLEQPAALDGTMAGDKVRWRQREWRRCCMGPGTISMREGAERAEDVLFVPATPRGPTHRLDAGC